MQNLFSIISSSGAQQLPRPFAPRARTFVGAMLAALSVGACAPDAWRPDAPYEAFLDRIQNNCMYKRIGRVEINRDFIDQEPPDPYFLDLTSRFYNGEIPQSAYVQGLQAAYDAEADSSGVRCILDQMPRRAGGAEPPGLAAPPR